MSLPLFVSRNGELIPAADAQVSIFNPALSGAYGVYESIEVAGGIPFGEEAHLQRLAHSAAMIDLPLPAGVPTFRRWIAQVLDVNHAQDCGLKIFVLGPENGDGAVAFIYPQPSPDYPAALYASGATTITVEGQRSIPQAKTLNTLVSFLAQRKARAAGVHEALLHHAGCLTEGSNSNLFAVLDDAIITAPARQVLSGVARDVVLAVAADGGLPMHETDLALADMPRWQECFITSSSRHVMPVTWVNGRPVGDGRVGRYTRRLMDLYQDYFRQVLAGARVRR